MYLPFWVEIVAPNTANQFHAANVAAESNKYLSQRSRSSPTMHRKMHRELYQLRTDKLLSSKRSSRCKGGAGGGQGRD
jgi:hypothetical protein